MPIIQYVLCLLGIVLAIPLLVLIVLAFKLTITKSGMIYLVTLSLLAIGLIIAPLRLQYSLLLVSAGVFGLTVTIIARWILMRQNQSLGISMITLPAETGPRWLCSLFDEQDAIIFSEYLSHREGLDSNREHKGLDPALLTAYSEIRAHGIFPTPILDTILNIQKPNGFDTIIVKPKDKAQFGVVFLHGYMGNVTGQSWEIAQAVKEAGGLTICPSMDQTGYWAEPDGIEILDCTIAYLRQQGIQKFFLGGYSNGGYSMGLLTQQLKTIKGLSGLIFIDGFLNGTVIGELGLPVLIIEGLTDQRFPRETALKFVKEVGGLATYAEVDSDHFLIMKQPQQVQKAITKWLKNQTAQ